MLTSMDISYTDVTTSKLLFFLYSVDNLFRFSAKILTYCTFKD